ncbi:hypothetical protein [Nocardioides aurantiacus]|uniref:Uncharacterized protein n=1 Tax=Nocardioides aurantiacus TaxID=86796 RepID=A0A3N2CR95_9ACTN|nr:hypothetical protein [Nocardioides aurantiacus]ROR90062.1 hypothetical protein EDD33_0897 [Nocardioides aurantiacus]
MSTTSPSARRSVKVAHLVMALLFLGVVAVWALVVSDAVDADQVAFLVPGVLVVAGVLGLLASVLSARNRARRPQPDPVPPLPEPHVGRDRSPDADLHDDLHDDSHDDLEHTAPLTPTRTTDQESR